MKRQKMWRGRRSTGATEKRHRGPYGRKFWLIMEAQGRRCYLCVEEFEAKDWATVDHVRPKVHGWTRHGNVLLAHKGCNHAKGQRMPYACEVIYLEAVNLRLPRDFGGSADLVATAAE